MLLRLLPPILLLSTVMSLNFQYVPSSTPPSFTPTDNPPGVFVANHGAPTNGSPSRGVYTAMEVRDGKIVGRSFHMERILEGVTKVNVPPSPSLPTLLTSLFSTCESFICASSSSPAASGMITVCLTPPLSFGCHIMLSSPPTDSEIVVNVVLGNEAGRLGEHVGVKRCSWAIDRRPLEGMKIKVDPGDGVGSEVVMTMPTVDESSGEQREYHALEGLVSNFFVITPSGDLLTAPSSSVLQGYKRSVFLAAASDLNIPVRFAVPVSCLGEVGCAFTTSSWGGGREVKEIYVDGELRWSKEEGAENDIFRRLKERVREIEEEEVG
ncbi:hypothetical protein TrCOL_g1967 [Triparma columacea]|uniref:Uncharacterized protein n=1 Tax=Triparma columacea TaxID=722753 RepID=A0A9W7G8W6_9STRA|nr:hypothetical protein TrCOL_g1967 [Triparma columacea]